MRKKKNNIFDNIKRTWIDFIDWVDYVKDQKKYMEKMEEKENTIHELHKTIENKDKKIVELRIVDLKNEISNLKKGK